MRNFINKTFRNLSPDEHRAILECEEILNKAFKKKVFTVVINPNNANKDDVFGVAFGFDMVY
jgi:hypothetical protein